MHPAFRQVMHFFEIRSRSNIDWPPHLHDDIELICVRQGSGQAFCDSRRYFLRPGSIFLTFPNQSHHYTQCASGDYIILNIKADRLRYHSDIFLRGQPTSALYNGTDPSLYLLLEAILAEFEASGYTVVIDGFLTAFFEKLFRGYRIEKTVLQKNCMLDILQYCSLHYLEDIRLNDIARELHISPSHISHLFNQRLQMSFSNYINSLRLKDAIKLLESKDCSIAQIASLSGFSAIRTFNRAFHALYGMSPTDYRTFLQEKEKKQQAT